MARKRKTNSEVSKQFSGFMKRNKTAVTAFFVIALLIAAAAVWLNNFLCSASCFEISKVEVVKPGREGGLYKQREYFNLGYPVNFFTVDPSSLSKKIKEAHPEYQIVVITKFLPNRVVATIKDRQAVARIKFGTLLTVDFDGIVVADSGNSNLLPLITGLESSLTNPKAGVRIKSKRLPAALNMLQLIYSRNEFRRMEVTNIDMTYPDKAFFEIDGIKVVTGNTDFEGKLDSLAEVFANSKVDKGKVDLIDLRFTDPTVTFKPENK